MLSLVFYLILVGVIVCFNFSFWLVSFALILIFLFVLLNFSFIDFYGFVSYVFGMDLISYCLVILSCWLLFLVFVSSSLIYWGFDYVKNFEFLCVVLLLVLCFAFCSVNFFWFYLFFDFSVVLVLVLIFGWGYQPGRLGAGLYLLMYTLLASLPLLVVIFYVYVFFIPWILVLLMFRSIFMFIFLWFCLFWLGCRFLFFIFGCLSLMWSLRFPAL